MKNFDLEMKLKAHSEKMKNSIVAPFDISDKIMDLERGNMRKPKTVNWIKKTAYSAAGVAAAFLLTVNCVPSLAYAVSDVPVLGTIVRVVTFNRFEVNEENYEAKIATPKLEGLINKELQEKLNKEFAENANSVIGAFEKDIKELSEAYGDKNFHLGVDADYIVRTDNENILAIDWYIVNTAASSSTTHRFYTIDKKTGTLLELESLFAEDVDYITPISDYILGEMKKQNETSNGLFWVNEDDISPFEKIREDQNFFINDKGNIVISFDKYEVAAGAQGSPEFEIPNDIIKNILK